MGELAACWLTWPSDLLLGSRGDNGRTFDGAQLGRTVSHRYVRGPSARGCRRGRCTLRPRTCTGVGRRLGQRSYGLRACFTLVARLGKLHSDHATGAVAGHTRETMLATSPAPQTGAKAILSRWEGRLPRFGSHLQKRRPVIRRSRSQYVVGRDMSCCIGLRSWPHGTAEAHPPSQ